jgi:hypothetical protein
MNSTLGAKKSSFCVANLRNSWLFRAIGALNLNLFAYNLLRPELIRGSLAYFFEQYVEGAGASVHGTGRCIGDNEIGLA